MNLKYFSSSEIYARLTSVHRKKMDEFERFTIMRWCAELQTELLRDPSGMEFKTIELGKPVGLMVRVPMEVGKLEKVYNRDTGKCIDYNSNGEYLFLSEHDAFTIVQIDAYIHPIDEDGYPLIRVGYEKACEAYCVYQMYHEDYINGTIDGQRWNDISQTKDWEIGAAERSWMGVDDSYVKKIHQTMVNTGYKKISRYGKR